MNTATLQYDRAYRALVDDVCQGRLRADQVAGEADAIAAGLELDAGVCAEVERSFWRDFSRPACLTATIDWGIQPQAGHRLCPEFRFETPDSAGTPEVRMLLDEQLDQTGWSEQPVLQRRQQYWVVEQSLRLAGCHGDLPPGEYAIQTMVRLPDVDNQTRCYQGRLKFRLFPETASRKRRFELVLDDSSASLEGLEGLLQADDVSVKISKSALLMQPAFLDSLRQKAEPREVAPEDPVQAEFQLWPAPALVQWQTSYKQPASPVQQKSRPAVTPYSFKIDRTRRGVRLQIHGREIVDRSLLRLVEIVPSAAAAQAGVAVPTQLADWIELYALDLSDTSITDETLTRIGTFSGLRVLLLDGTGLTDRGLLHLEGLQQLQMLSLAGTAITDRGLQTLSNLPALEALTLDRTRITNASIDVCLRIENLSELSIRCCRAVDVEAIERLQSRCPDLDLEF